MKRLRNILHYNQKYFLFAVVVVLILSLIITNYYPFHSKYKINQNTFEGIITNIKVKGNKLTIEIKAKEKLIVYYYKEDFKKIGNNLKIGDTIYIKGELTIPKKNTIPNLFNYQKYLYNNKIYYLLHANEIIKTKNNTSILFFFKNKINNYLNKFKSSAYLQTFIMGNKNFINQEALDSYQENGLSHLLTISGLHITFLIGSIFYLSKKITNNIIISYYICLIIIIFYIIFLDFTPSLLRSGIMYILTIINKIYNFKIKTINLMYIVLIVILLINPFYLYNIGFQLSYLISLCLIVFKNKISNIKNYVCKTLYISYISFLISLPIIILNFNQINIIGIILNIIYIPIITYVVLPLTFITMLLPFLDKLLFFIINGLEQTSLCINQINIFKITLSTPSVYLIAIYYICIIITLIKHKYLLFLLIIVIYNNCKVYLDNNFHIIMLDVGQGDSILIRYPYNKLNILIDTGGIYNYETSQNIISYFKSIGIKRIDYLIITHGDYDHMGEAINLVNNFKIEKVIFNCGEFNELEQYLIKVLDKKKIPYYSCIKELNINDNKLYFLNNKDYGNENDNSSVIYTELNNHKFLFMGDAGVKVEEDLIEKYNLKDIDALKVGHHGSKTSSSKEFIDKVNPKYSTISVGKNNRYGHPNDSVLDNLEGSKIYRTDQDGSIMFRIKNNKLRIETCPP